MEDWHVIVVYESGVVRESVYTSTRPRSLDFCLGYERHLNKRVTHHDIAKCVYMVVHEKHLRMALRSFNEDQA